MNPKVPTNQRPLIDSQKLRKKKKKKKRLTSILLQNQTTEETKEGTNRKHIHKQLENK